MPLARAVEDWWGQPERVGARVALGRVLRHEAQVFGAAPAFRRHYQEINRLYALEHPPDPGLGVFIDPPPAANIFVGQQHAYYNAEVVAGLMQNAVAAPEREEEKDDMPANFKTVNNFKVGCDPEFACLDAHGRLQRVDGLVPHDGPVGYDHGGRIAEFRPRASLSTLQILRNLQKIMNSEGCAGIRQYKWRGGGCYRYPAEAHRFEPLGGHVHLDVKYLRPGEETEEYRERLGALDRVTLQLEELDILPKEESRYRRIHGVDFAPKYGQFSDTRPAGRKPRMEYRSPASWIFSPRVALTALTAIKLACAHPRRALEVLGREPSSYQLRHFFELFRGDDDDVRALHDWCFTARKGFKGVRCNPDVDIKEAWEVRIPG